MGCERARSRRRSRIRSFRRLPLLPQAALLLVAPRAQELAQWLVALSVLQLAFPLRFSHSVCPSLSAPLSVVALVCALEARSAQLLALLVAPQDTKPTKTGPRSRKKRKGQDVEVERGCLQ